MTSYEMRISYWISDVCSSDLKENKADLDRLAEGRIDVIVGTHRLLQKDVRFKDLGLVIVDEEQRFGVRQKEALKAMRANVHLLTLTATPIPRTLNMAMRSEEHTSELQSLMRISYAVFCLKKKNTPISNTTITS